MTTTFDPQAFLDAGTDAANSTKIDPIPEGEYVGMTGKPEAKKITSNKDGKEYIVLVVPIKFDDQAVKDATGMDQPAARYETFISLNENGGIDSAKGKNVGLGKLREACGLNVPGARFNFHMLEGRPVKCLITNRTDGDNIYSDVKAVRAP